MPAHTAPQAAYPVEYPAPRKYVLVISCMDARLLDDLVYFLDHDNLTNRYYHLTFAGTSLGLTARVNDDLGDPNDPPAHFAQWRQAFIDHFQAAVLLTKGTITDVYIVQHADCGAFREYLGRDAADMTHTAELQMHRDYAKALLDDIVKNFCDVYNPPGKPDPALRVQEKKPSIYTFFMDLRGGVTLLDRWPEEGEAVDRVCTNYGCQCPKKDEADKKPTTKPGKGKKPAK